MYTSLHQNPQPPLGDLRPYVFAPGAKVTQSDGGLFLDEVRLQLGVVDQFTIRTILENLNSLLIIICIYLDVNAFCRI